MKYFNYQINENVLALTTTTELGNMAYQVGDDKDDVINNRSILLKDIGLKNERLVFVHQTHSDITKEVTVRDLGKGQDDFESGVEADAIYTKEKCLAIGVFHADCAPIFFFDPTVPLVGVIHAGHKGTLKHIAFKAIRYVVDKEKLNVRNIKVFIGPLRRKASYLLTDEERMEVITSACPISDNYFDVAFSNRMDLICAGIDDENIKDINIDTYTDERCYSAYKKTPVGRMASIIMLK